MLNKTREPAWMVKKSRRTYEIELIDGQEITSRRGLVFLISEGDTFINAKSVFHELPKKKELEVRTRFDYWLDGGTNDRWFHGWPDIPDYKDCFVFKWKQKNQNHRLYGFLCNPSLKSPAFQLCVLVTDATKSTEKTDKRILDYLTELKSNDAVIQEISGVTGVSVPRQVR